MGLPPPEHDPASVRELAERILADPRYDRAPEPLLERLQRWFADRIGDVLGTLVGGGAGTVFAWAVVLGAIGAITYLVIRHGRSVRLPHAATAPVAGMVELARSPSEWRDEAARLEAEGRWKEALRSRHRALVAELVRRGAIPEQAGRTAGEYVADVAAVLPAAAEPMAAATALFEAAWYGDARTGPDEAERFQAMEERILEPSTARAGAGV